MTLKPLSIALLATAIHVVLLFGPAASPASAQSRPAEMDRIEKAFGEGDVKALLNTMSSRVAIAVFGASREYSRTQAEYVLKEFFDEYPPVRFAVSRFSETDQGAFVAGRYKSRRGGNDIDVYLRLRDQRGKWELREIIIRTEPR